MTSYLASLFQNIVNSGHLGLTLLLISFLGGVLASVSPCSLSMLPIIIGYIGGYSKESPLKVLIQMILFVFGTSIVFTAIGILCALTGRVFVSIAPSYFYLIIASIILIMGLNIVGILEFNVPVLIKQLPKNNSKNNYLFPILIGAVFALAGTPCSTPILASIMALASAADNLLYAVVMLFLFSLGQGIILILAGIFTSFLKKLKQYSNVSEIILKISGILLILSALYIYYKIFSPLL